VTSEFAAIARIRSRLPQPPDASEIWIGDDAAVLPGPSGGHTLLAADAAVAGVHADLTLTGLDDLGWKAMASALSDLAAMGGEPRHSLVTVAAPPGTDLDLLYDGLAAAASAYLCPIVGGDLTGSPVLVVTVAVTGWCEGDPVQRGGARPGDLIWVTGPLGRAAAGLRCLRSPDSPGPGGGSLGVQIRRDLIRAHARPEPDFAGGRAARLGGARAMIDVSDGLAADIGHLAEASGVGVELESVPVAEGAAMDEALHGGDDYVLLFCAPDTRKIDAAFAGLPQPARIGRCTADTARMTLAGKRISPVGWEHQF
jgi:thiamine-monophosphate kinase